MPDGCNFIFDLRTFLYQQAADPFWRLNGRRYLTVIVTVIELLSQGHYLTCNKIWALS
jgi:hypothetical protein